MLDNQYELFNWFASTHPLSHFRNQLIVAKTTTEARYVLLDNRLTIRSPSGRVQRSHLDAKGIVEALEDTFGLTPQPEWSDLLQAAASRSSRD